MGNAKNLKTPQSRPHTNPQTSKFKHNKAAGSNKSSGQKPSFKRPPHAHGKRAFVKSKEDLKKERALKFQQRQEARAQKQKELEEERAKAKQEKEEKVRQYKKKRLERTKALSKRTQRGQPLMKDRMQLLLKQIQEMKRNG
uniref:Thyroid transcription factor 1-associated protein 26 n=1 Tax=Stomoxys calcitrans TaxID=35570 RepID=A0A1I8PSM9_STOCA